MNVINCRKCGKLFNYVVGPRACQACREKLEEKYKEVKEYIRANDIANIQDIVIDCDVETEQINQWIREERLEFSKNSQIKISCESCGTEIRTGRFCSKCKSDSINRLNGAYESKRESGNVAQTSTKENPRMRFLDL